MHESGTWRVRPGQSLTFGRGDGCTVKLPAGDRGLSRSAGRLVFQDGAWWLHNDSSSTVRLQGVLDSYVLRLRLPDLDDLPGQDSQPGRAGGDAGPAAGPTAENLVTSSRRRAPLT